MDNNFGVFIIIVVVLGLFNMIKLFSGRVSAGKNANDAIYARERCNDAVHSANASLERIRDAVWDGIDTEQKARSTLAEIGRYMDYMENAKKLNEQAITYTKNAQDAANSSWTAANGFGGDFASASVYHGAAKKFRKLASLRWRCHIQMMRLLEKP